MRASPLPLIAPLTLIAVLGLAPAASADWLWIDAALQRELQRFPEDVIPNRLDGAARGWSIGGHASVVRRLAVTVEWSDGGRIEDRRSLTLDANGRTVTIASALVHSTRALVVLGGFAHTPLSRLRLAYLAGVARTEVRREFSSTASDLILVTPSNTTAPAQAVIDRFAALAAGVDARVRIARRVHALAAVRVQSLDLGADQRGWSLRTMAGGGWTF
jgi:hypothetical protein